MQQEEIRKLEDVIRKVKELDKKINVFSETKIKEIILEVLKDLNIVFNNNHSNSSKYDVKIVTTEEEIIKLAKVGYECQSIGQNKWLMRKEL